MQARVRHTNGKDFGTVDVGNTYPGDEKSVNGTYYRVLKCQPDSSGAMQVLVTDRDSGESLSAAYDNWPNGWG